MMLAEMQKQGGMDRPIGGSYAAKVAMGEPGTVDPLGIVSTVGKVTEVMKPSETIPSTKGVIGESAGKQVDAFLKGAVSNIDPATLSAPLTGAADLAMMGLQSLDPSLRPKVIEQLKGATKEEKDTFLARLMGQLSGAIVIGKTVHATGIPDKLGVTGMPNPMTYLADEVAASIKAKANPKAPLVAQGPRLEPTASVYQENVRPTKMGNVSIEPEVQPIPPKAQDRLSAARSTLKD
jgi:hypothetical protein